MENASNPDIIDELIGGLGFRETEKLKLLKQEIINELSGLKEAYPLPPHLISLRTTYQLSAEEVINQLPPEDFAKGQIGLIIAQATMFQEAGWDKRFQEDIADALAYAEGMGFDNIAQAIKSIQTNPPQ